MQYLARLSLLVLLSIPPLTWAIDLQPNDIVAPLPDKNYLTLSYYGTENTTLYRNGSPVEAGPYSKPVIDNNSFIVRAARTYTFAGLPAVSYVQLPYGIVQPSGSLSNYPSQSGTGDLSLVTAIWPYADRESRTYVGVAGYLTIPTSNYSTTQPLNIGDNRYKWDLQVGFQKPIAGSLDGMIAIDTMWYGANSQCAAACGLASNATLTQKPLTTLQLGPVYRINQTFTISASYFYVAGGATSINDAYQNNVMNTQRFLLSALIHTEVGRFSLQNGRDMEVKNGYFQDRVLALRYMREF
jgi:hypothetical protein